MLVLICPGQGRHLLYMADGSWTKLPSTEIAPLPVANKRARHRYWRRIEQLKAVNEAAAGLAAVRQLEADEGAAMALAQARLRPLAAGWLFGPEISD